MGAGADTTHDRRERSTYGPEFARALGRKDFQAAGALLEESVDFRALTPRRSWEATTPRAVIDDVLSRWFGETVDIEEVVAIESDSFADRERVGYRLQGRNEDGPFALEQQAYYTLGPAGIGWMRVLCSGFRPSED